MKTTHVVLGVALVAASSMVLGSTSYIFANSDYKEVRGEQHKRWNNNEERGERHERRGERGEKGDHQGKMKREGNPADHIKDIAVSDVNSTETDSLLKQHEEERMANELYAMFYEKYGLQVFDNISNSEAHHMDAIQTLLTRYELETPTSYDHIQSLYDELEAKGSLSLQDALEVGLMIEKVDIDDIKTAIKNTDNDDIKTIFTFIGGASYNHMRGFAKNMDTQGFETDIDFSNYLNDDEVHVRGPLQWKLAEELEAEGVDLPEGATASAVRGHIEQERGNHGERGRNSNMRRNTKEMRNGQNHRKQGKNIQNNKRSYKRIIIAKFQTKLDGWDTTTLESIQTKIVAAKENVTNNPSFSLEKKEKYILLLDALDEVITDRLNGNDAVTILNSLLNI